MSGELDEVKKKMLYHLKEAQFYMRIILEDERVKPDTKMYLRNSRLSLNSLVSSLRKNKICTLSLSQMLAKERREKLEKQKKELMKYRRCQKH